MKTIPRKGKAAFTLIELLAVITIIVILAGLVVGGLSYVSDKQASSQAKVQMALISKALEDYKSDMGAYPVTSDKAGDFSGSAGTGTSSILFNALYFDSDSDDVGAPADTDQKIYLAELDPATSKQGWTSGTAGSSTPIIDPWGNQYCYRSAMGPPPTPPATGSATANTATQNPDFDLWSMGKNGRTNADPKHKDSLDDIKSP